MVDKNVDKGKFSYGFLLSLAAYLLSSAVIALVPAVFGKSFAIGIINSMLFFGSIIWIPLSLIAGDISMKNGKKSAKIFVAASFFISLLVIGGCAGTLTQLGGSEPNITEPTSPSNPSYR